MCGSLWMGFVAAIVMAGFRYSHCQIHMTLMSLPWHLLGQCRTLCVGLKTKMDQLLDNGIGKGMWLFLLLVPPNWYFERPGFSCFVLQAMILLQCFVVDIDAQCGVHGSTGHFDLKLCSLGNPPSGSQGPVPLKWTGHPHVTALIAANQVRVRPCLAVLHYICIQTLVAAPHACTQLLLSCLLAMVSQVCTHSVAVPHTTLLVAAK